MFEHLPRIAFTGKAGSGKTTAAIALGDTHGYRLVSFAKPLKQAASLIWGPESRTDRSLLQWFGQVVRERDPDVWANAAEREINDIYRLARNSEQVRIVNDDLRFPNEYHLLKEMGFVIVRVVADRHIRIDRLRDNGKLQREEQLDDISETALDDYEVDYTLDNNETPEEVAEQLHIILRREGSRV